MRIRPEFPTATKLVPEHATPVSVGNVWPRDCVVHITPSDEVSIEPPIKVVPMATILDPHEATP